MGMLAGAEGITSVNTEEAVNAGVFGTPFYIVDGAEKFWGQDPDRGPGPVLVRHALTGFARHWGQGAGPALLLHCSLAHSGAWDGVAQALSDRLQIDRARSWSAMAGALRADPSRDYHDQATEAAALHLPQTP